ncbi:MAG: lipopolysaccharide biosynthesis protein [Minisyncoccota bacterium]
MSTIKSRLSSLLHWSEKYTKIDMVYLARGSFWSIAGQVSASVIALGLSVVMARYVPKDVYGQYKYVLAIISVLSAFSLNGIGTAVLQSAARGFDGALADSFKANMRWSFAIFIGTLGLGGYYLMAGNFVLGFGILLGGAVTPFLGSFNLYAPFLSGKKEFARQAWYADFVTNIIPALALIATALIAPRPLPLVAVYFIANLAATAYAYWRTARKLHRATAQHDPHMLHYGKHLSAIGILGGIAGNIDQLLLFHFTGATDLAIYNFATGIPDQIKGPLKMLDAMTQARFANRETADIRSSIRNKMFWMFIASIFIIGTYILVAPYLYLFLFPAYAVAIPYSQIYILSLFAMIASPAVSYLSAKKKIREQYIASVSISIFQIIVMSIGVIYWGLLGLIVARVLTRFFSGCSNFILYKITTKIG